MLGPSLAQWHERQQEIVLKNDPGCARQGVEVERNRAQTRIALTVNVDRPQQGAFKRFSFFLALGGIFRQLGGLLVLGVGVGRLGTTPDRLEGSRFVRWQIYRLAAGGSRE
jgi:hypothetical protein